jgi:Trypsin-like peptidase domain
VLTSEHVLLQGRKNQGICQSVSFPNQATGDFKSYDAELVASDWQSGLAILKVNTVGSEIDALAVNDLFSEQAPTGTDTLFVSGYPYADQDESMSTRGNLDRQKSLRHLMPNANEVLEIRGALGEFGMSGGPVFDGNGKMTGMLSHQYLVDRNGPTAVGTFTEQTDGEESHLLALKAADIKNWVQVAITGGFKPGFVRSAVDQMDGEDIVYSDGLTFRAIPMEKSCAASEPVGGVGGDYTAGDPVGVGGGDPVGVGGGGPGVPHSIVVEISKDRNPEVRLHATRWNIPKLSSWAENLKNSLLRSEIITSPGLIYRRDQGTGVTLVCTKSLEEYFRKLVADGTSALTYRSGGATGVNPPALVKELNAESVQVLKGAKELQSLVGNRELAVLKYAKFYSQLTTNIDSWMIVEERDIKPLICVTGGSCPFARDWTLLFTEHGEESQTLLRGLRRIAELLKALTVNGN